MGSTNKIISHCDFAPWNTITRSSTVIGLIDWEYSGPVDPLIELARVCWLFVQLYDNDVGDKIGLPSVEKRSVQFKLLIDGYELDKAKRSDLLEDITEVGVFESAEQAIELNVGEKTVGNMWGISWRARSVKWIIQNRKILEQAIR
jgi:thiamine kinase-like enzyme